MADKQHQAEADQLLSAAQGLGLRLDPGHIDRLTQYLDLLARWNRVYNLTAVKDRDEMVVRHAIDSLSVAPLMAEGSLLDIGTGAGLPGIPLAIALPELKITLLDVLSKRTRFLNQVVVGLNLENVQVVTSRVEDYAPGFCFDQITSRAFASLADMVAGSAHLLCQNGRYIAMKGDPAEDELQGVGEGWQTEQIKLDYEGRTGARHAVILSRPAS